MAENSKDDYQAVLFSNRLSKKYKQLRKWARKARISCYRLYDNDIPEIPLAVDLYELLPDSVSDKFEAARFFAGENARLSANDATVEQEICLRRYAVMFLYERPYEKPEAEENIWLTKMADQTAAVLNIDVSHIIIKTRRHDKGGSQYAKYDTAEKPLSGTVQEQGQLFRINLTSYLDTGLFFDHRPLRSMVRDSAVDKSVLNLFCYTGSFSVYSAEGKAARVESVDLSNTYLSWAEENMKLNGFSDPARYVYTRSDVSELLALKKAQHSDTTNRYDIIILDPPTFSNSKMSRTTLDINRDWATLVNDCLLLLNPHGTLYFSTNSRRLSFDATQIVTTTPAGCMVSAEDITAVTIPEDYAGTRIHRCWRITLGSPKIIF